MTFKNDGMTKIDCAAQCPKCKQPHHYTEFSFPIVNDRGYWLVECSRCRKNFVIELNNPAESGGKINGQISERHQEKFAGDRGIVADQVIRHNIDLNQNEWRFNYEAVPLYQCEKNSADLEDIAQTALEANYAGIASAYGRAQNFLLSRGPKHDYALVRLPLKCKCKGSHMATFYTPLVMNKKGPNSASDFLLADVSGANLLQTLDGIVSKNDAMDLLEKLIIRWNLLAEQILIVSPFVGTSFTPSTKQFNWKFGDGY